MMLRPDLQLVSSLIPQGSRVLDLGCGGGELLRDVIENRECQGTGVEIHPESVLAAINNGVPVIELDLDTQLTDFADDSYDIVVLSRTLQTVKNPEEVLVEMARIGTRMMVTMPNFGLWKHRLKLLSGHMPRSRDLPYSWYDTPNIKHATLIDLEKLFLDLGLRIEHKIPLDERGRVSRSVEAWPNLLAGAAIYVLVSDRRSPTWPWRGRP